MSPSKPQDRARGFEHFLAELRRRNVVRIALAYLAVAWLVIQLVGEIGPILGVPDWIPRFVLGLLALGFPVALVLAWVYELTNEGLRTMAQVDADASLRRVSPWLLNAVVISALTLALGYFIWESRFAGRPSSSAVESIAVLPFRDLSERGDQRYFAEGVAEELLAALSRVPGLRVAGRISSFSVPRNELTPEETAMRLGVTHLLEGSVRTGGGRLRVTAQLINAHDGFQVWSRDFEGSLSDVFRVQDEISALVVDGLGQGVGGAPAVTPPRVPSTSRLDAYDDYLLARYHLARRTTESMVEAIDRFRAAAEADPEFAPAWSGLAKALIVSPYYLGIESITDLVGEARAAAERAIELDPENAEAWSSLGLTQLLYDRKWRAAAEPLERAISLQPNDAGVANLYGDYLYTIGNYEGALEYESRAAELDPLSAANQHELALVYELLGRLDDAIEQERRAIEVGPDFKNAWSTLARYFLEAGRLEDARALLADPGAAIGAHSRLVLEAGLALQSEGREEALRRTDELLVLSRDQDRSLISAARLYAQLGEDAQAAALVREAHALRDPILLSPLYFFLPEDWADAPLLRAALDEPGLRELFDLRRAHIAAGRGRGSGT